MERKLAVGVGHDRPGQYSTVPLEQVSDRHGFVGWKVTNGELS